ncbi:uncharacterized protein C6orf118-like isoform 2-T2 [Spinachia spinachia]
MSSRCKPKPACFRRDIHGLLGAAEAGQKADILTYSSGHLEPGSLKPGPPRWEQKQPFWRMPRGSAEALDPVSPAKALKKKAVKHSARTASDVSRSRRAPATDRSSCADKTEETRLPKIDLCSPNSLVLRPRAPHQKKSNPPSDMLGKQPPGHKGPSNKGQLKTKQRLGATVVAMQDLRAGTNVAEMHERKLHNELKRLSAASWPGRDRLAVFADVFDDVCEGSPVFGRILREIKTEYDVYVNHLMASRPLLQNMPLETLKGLGNDRVRQMELEKSEKEVFELEQEAKRALEENKQARNESKNIPATVGPEDSDMTNASLSGLQDRGLDVGHSSSVQSKRLQVLNTWRENQQLEEELKERPVSSVTTTATQRCIKDLKVVEDKLSVQNGDNETDCLK